MGNEDQYQMHCEECGEGFAGIVLQAVLWSIVIGEALIIYGAGRSLTLHQIAAFWKGLNSL